MAQFTTEQIGQRAEIIAALDLGQLVVRRYNRALFRTTFLGEKYPTADFLIDALDREGHAIGYCFAQVKGTAAAAPTSMRLPVSVTDDSYRRLARLTAPTYLIGVDIRAARTYCVAVDPTARTAPASVTKAFCLTDEAVRIMLYREVLAYWRSNRPTVHPSRFHDG